MTTTTLAGMLEIDHERGVVYFHASDPKVAERYGTVSVLRLGHLGAIPEGRALDYHMAVARAAINSVDAIDQLKVLKDELIEASRFGIFDAVRRYASQLVPRVEEVVQLLEKAHNTK